MNAKERQEAIESLKVICREIGCSKLSPAMCTDAVQLCSIIGKILTPSNTASTGQALMTPAGDEQDIPW
jgi:hypothetical protein